MTGAREMPTSLVPEGPRDGMVRGSLDRETDRIGEGKETPIRVWRGVYAVHVGDSDPQI